MVTRRTPIWFILAVVVILFAIGGSASARSSMAQPPAPQSPEAATAAITPLLQYQGRLTNPATGQPVSDGVYPMTFSLYDAATGGATLWTETKNVQVAGGLFSTALGDSTSLPQSLFSGQSVWLGIKVGSDLEATPRQAVLPVAYALGLVPGASIAGSLASPALSVSNSSGPALVTSGTSTLGGNVTINGTLSGGTHAHSGADITSGTVVDARIDSLIARDAEVAASYYNKTDADNRYVNVTGPESLSANSTAAAFSVNQSGSGVGGYFSSAATFGVRGETSSTSGGQAGVLGVASWVTTTLVQESGVEGKSFGGYGVSGISMNGYGIIGYSTNSVGVRGEAVAGSSAGVWGGSWGTGPGVYGRGMNSHGVQGSGDTASGNYGGYFTGWGGVYGEGTRGVVGATSQSSGIGVLASSSGDATTALYASKSSGSGNALQVSNSGIGSAASIQNSSSSTADALQLWNYGTGRVGYFYNSSASTGDAFSLYNYGSGDTMNVYANGTGTNALYVSKSGGGNYAGYFSGNVYVNGTLSKAGGSFKIDHPLDPANKYLEHSFVESPDMMNVYNGNITTDANGDATVTLPDYFEALNRDFRYQLTVIGQFAQAIVKDEVKDNRFTIKTDKPNVKVSWQVTGIRQDAWANANRIPVEEAKPANEQGTYLYPQGYAQPASKGIDYARGQVKQTAPLTQTAPLLPTASAKSAIPPSASGPSTLP
jgi:trimeric autotransporter adhesin